MSNKSCHSEPRKRIYQKDVPKRKKKIQSIQAKNFIQSLIMMPDHSFNICRTCFNMQRLDIKARTHISLVQYIPQYEGSISLLHFTVAQ